MTFETDNAEKVRARFTSTADAFASSARARRGEEAGHFAELATAGLPNAASLLAVDVACGPGTFARPLASRVGRVTGVDLTPAMIERARVEAAREGLANMDFVVGDANALPFANGAAGLVVCGYSIHHIPDAKRVITEMARIVRPGGRLGIVDLVVDDGADADANNAIERARDSSHCVKLTAQQFHAIFESVGLRQVAEEKHERRYDFNEWMRTAGQSPGDPIYMEVRRMMDDPKIGGAAGFKPVPSPNSGALKFMNTVLLYAGEKMA
jgi:ubiquinone/menaquinone biosynthesis C-methylase UbiE